MPGDTSRGAVAALAVGLAVAGASALAEPPAAGPERQPAQETLKERLSDKASDDQRVDNCKVAQDRRGSKPRPDCAPQEASRPPQPR